MWKITMPAAVYALAIAATKQETTMSDAIAEARRVLADVDRAIDDDRYYSMSDPGRTAKDFLPKLQVALSNLLSHVERLTAPAGDRAELVSWFKHCVENRLFGVESRQRFKDAAALLEADARREVALAEAIAEIEALKAAVQRDEERESRLVKAGHNDAIDAVLAILAKVADGGER
jgi:hypothetical protein